jgi:DNA topoisomerase-2
MCLVNGAEGIGTGWSTSVPMYNPRDLVKAIRFMIKGEEPAPLHPWYKGYTGVIEPNGKGTGYFHNGIWE